jgi:hypothetical protein
MLLVYFKGQKNVINSPDISFKHRYKEEWLTTDIGRRIIKEIDKSEVNDTGTIIFSPVLGSIPPERISGGAKALFFAKFKDDFISSTCFGDNCAELLLSISENRDVKIVEYHLLGLNDTVGARRKVYFPELKIYAKDYDDYIGICIDNMKRFKHF